MSDQGPHDSVPVVAGSTPAPDPAKSTGRAIWLLLDLVSATVWIYIVLKLFVFDFDLFIAQRYFPDSAWLLNLRFAFFLGIFALLLLLFRGKGTFVIVIYILFFPLILIAWKIPRLILRRRSWTLAFTLINMVISFFQSIKYRAVVSACWLIAFIVILLSDNWLALSVACVTLFILIVASYLRRLIFIVKPTGIFRAYRKIFSAVRSMVVSGKLDDDLQAIAIADFNNQQLQRWKAKVEFPVLCSRVSLFVAKRLRDYQRSGVHIIGAVLISLSLVIMTTISFAAINYGLYKIEPNLFETVHPTFFTFVYYSFKTFLFSDIKDVTAVSVLSQSIAMIESFFALFLMGLFFSLVIPFRNLRYAAELNDTINTIEADNASMESFIRTEYKVNTIDDAIVQLQRLQATMIRALLFLSEALKE